MISIIFTNYLGPVLGVINPFQEVAAEEKSVTNAFKLRGDIALMNGYEWDNFLEEYAQQEREYKSLTTEQQTKIIADNEGVNII